MENSVGFANKNNDFTYNSMVFKSEKAVVEPILNLS